MLRVQNPEEAVRLLPNPELRSLIQRIGDTIESNKATIQEYELYILAVLEAQQRNLLACNKTAA